MTKMRASIGKVTELLVVCLGLSPLCHVSAAAQDEYLAKVEEALRAVSNDSLQKAEHLFSQALRISPGDSRNALIYSNIGKIKESQGEFEEAINSYSKAILQYPGTPAFLRPRAVLYLSTAQYQLAISDYKRLAEQDPQNAEYNSAIGYAYTKLSRFAEADDYLNKALAVNPKEYVALLGKTIVLLETGHLNEARTQIDILIGMFPDKAELYSLRSDQEAREGRSELALRDLDKAVELEPQNKNYVLRRAYLHFEAHHYSKALEDFQNSIRLGIPRSAINTEMQKCKDEL